MLTKKEIKNELSNAFYNNAIKFCSNQNFIGNGHHFVQKMQQEFMNQKQTSFFIDLIIKNSQLNKEDVYCRLRNEFYIGVIKFCEQREGEHITNVQDFVKNIQDEFINHHDVELLINWIYNSLK